MCCLSTTVLSDLLCIAGQIQREEWVRYYVARSNELRCRAAADTLQAQILADSATQMSPKSRRKKVVWPDELLGDRDSLEDVRVGGSHRVVSSAAALSHALLLTHAKTPQSTSPHRLES